MSGIEISVFYESPSKGEDKTVILWVSRHNPLPAQIKTLEEKLDHIKIIKVSGIIPNAQTVVDLAKKYNAKIIVPVLPMSFIAHLAEAGKRNGFIVLFAKMEAIAQVPPEEARKIVEEAPDRRTMTTYADGTAKVHEFKAFEKVKEVKIVTEPW